MPITRFIKWKNENGVAYWKWKWVTIEPSIKLISTCSLKLLASCCCCQKSVVCLILQLSTGLTAWFQQSHNWSRIQLEWWLVNHTRAPQYCSNYWFLRVHMCCAICSQESRVGHFSLFLWLKLGVQVPLIPPPCLAAGSLPVTIHIYTHILHTSKQVTIKSHSLHNQTSLLINPTNNICIICFLGKSEAGFTAKRKPKYEFFFSLWFNLVNLVKATKFIKKKKQRN